MKTIYTLFCLLSFLVFINFTLISQVQIGQNILAINSETYVGYSVSLSANGERLAIAQTSNGSGNVLVYELNNGNWQIFGNQTFGILIDSKVNAVSLSDDGNRFAVMSVEPKVWVYEYKGEWVQIGDTIEVSNINRKPFGDNRADWDIIKLSGNGKRLAFGIPSHDNDDNGNKSGILFTYEYIGNDWVQIGEPFRGYVQNEWCGHSLSYSSDGEIFAFGLPGNHDPGEEYGKVKVFKYNSGNWEQIGDDIPGRRQNECSGISVSLSSDGNIIAIGAHNRNQGYARMFKNNSGQWKQIGNEIPGEDISDEFGWVVSLSGDGKRVAVSAPDAKIDSISSYLKYGHVRIYDYESYWNEWRKSGHDISGDDFNSGFSKAMSISKDGNKVVIGAYAFGRGLVQVYGQIPILEEYIPPNNLDIILYPNPTQNKLSIVTYDKEIDKIQLYNASGIYIQDLPIPVERTDLSNIFNLSEYPSGTYFIKFYKGEESSVKKIIKH